jgi:riboflavin synthase
MFTGIVEAVGTVVQIEELDGGRRCVINSRIVAAGLEVGDSVAVQGACLTAAAISPGSFTVEMVSETLSRTTLGGLVVGSAVNLERAMPAAGRFDGHIVQGHVDGVGSIVAVEDAGTGTRVTVQCPEELMRYVVEKGSITVDGVSLTVADLHSDGFVIALIPHTLSVTTLGSLEPPAPVNLEVDILSKYVERLLKTGA